MESLAILIGGTLAIVVVAVSYLFGRQSANDAPPINTSGLDPEVAAELARLQERERTLSTDVSRQAGEIQRFGEALVSSQREHGATRERLAVAEERALGLSRTLGDERESSDAARRALSAELEAAIESRDRLQSSLANTSQLLAAAEERAAGFQRNVA